MSFLNWFLTRFWMKSRLFWVGFGANFKPSILKQDKGVWFSGVEMPENAVRQSLSAFRFVILLRMIWNSYAVRSVFRRISRLLRIHLSVAVWWLKIKLFWQYCEQKLTSLLQNRVTHRTKTKNGLQAICASPWAKNGGDKVYKNFDEMPVMLSVNQAAEVLGISNVSLYKLIEKDKSFPVVQLGRRKSIPKEQLKEWIDEKSKR